MNQREYDQLSAQAQFSQQGSARGYAQEQSARSGCDTNVKAEPLAEVAKTIAVQIRGNLSPRIERELREEVAGKLAQGYRVTRMVDSGYGVTVELQKFEPWTLDELFADIKSKLKGE